MLPQQPTTSFDPRLFVNRAKEKKLFFDTVRASQQRTVLEITGVAGQGKSELLKWMYHTAREKEGCLAAYVDFELADFLRPEIYPILQTIAEQVKSQIADESFAVFYGIFPDYVDALQTFYRNAYLNPQAADRSKVQPLEDELIQAFHDDLTAILESRKVVICLDSTEKAYLRALRDFEEQILTLHTGHANFFLITAGQKKIRWQTQTIRDLVQAHELPRLGQNAVQEQIARLQEKKGFSIEQSEQISQELFQLTLGHPFSNYQLINFWTNGFTSRLDQTVARERRRSGLRFLIKKFIEERTLENVRLSNEYPPLSEILWYLAPIRRLEFGILWYALSAFLPNWFQNKPYEFSQDLMDVLTKTQIFIPLQPGIGFDMEPVVRNILIEDMRDNQPDIFLTVNQRLAEQYDRWVAQSRDATQVKNIIERLYHYATSLHATQDREIERKIQADLIRYLDTYFTAEFIGTSEVIETTVALREQFNRLITVLEHDQELAELVDTRALLNLIQERQQTVLREESHVRKR